MALSSLIRRRNLTRNLFRYVAATPVILPSSSAASSPLKSLASSPSQKWPPLLLFQSRDFTSSPVSLSSSQQTFEPSYTWSYEEFKPRELGIDAIEGCDFNHWLIVIDFPKEPRPSPEEMVRFYEETCAKALDISVEEAKKKIYACSTSNYTGFHVEVTEVESEKFNGQPGVVFVLPDSYADPEKKEYGGDKYINGVIIPRPRPTLNGRRNRDQPKQEQKGGPMPKQQGNPSYSHGGPTQGGLKPNQQTNPSSSHQQLAPQSYPPKQSNGLPGQGERRGPPDYPPGQIHGQPGLREVCTPQESYGRPLGERRDPQPYLFEQNYYTSGPGERRDFTPMVASRERNHYQQGNGGSIPLYSVNYNQVGPGNFYSQEQRGSPPGDRVNYGPPTQQGSFRGDYQYYGPPQGPPHVQEVGRYQGQGASEAYWQGANYAAGQGTTFVYGPGYPRHIQGQSFLRHEQMSGQVANFYPQEQREFEYGYHSNYAPPPRYQGAFREDYQNYRLAPVAPHGQGVGGYQGHGAPEAYWQGANSTAVGQETTYGYRQSYPGHIQSQGFSQEQPRNMQGLHYYSHEQREVMHGYQNNYGPPRHHGQGGFREDYRHYGPPQGTSYGQGVEEYQGQGPPMAYWRGPKY